MSATQFFPIPPAMFALVIETVSRRVSRLPFLRSGVNVTGEVIGVFMECLNAESTRTLPLITPRDAPGGAVEGLDRLLEQRLQIPGKDVTPVIGEVLIAAGIAEYTEILDRQCHRPRKGLRLLKPWTWDIAAPMGQAVHLPQSGSDDGLSMSWMSTCPVCKTGILNKVIGKQLFGIPRTDFIIECTHCGAKFIPVGTQFRLVSIATIRDPLWKKHLDKTYPAETWASLARGTAPGGAGSRASPRVSNPMAGTPSLTRPQRTGLLGLKKIKDGSLAVPFGEKILYFRPLRIRFSGGVREDVFAKAQKLLSEYLQNPAYSHLVDRVNERYSQYLTLPAGVFLGQLKDRHDPFYREFLNISGDERYCSFRLEDTDGSGKNGVVIVAVGEGLYESLDCHETVRTMVNDRLGRILPDDCFLHADRKRCRINALFCAERDHAGLYIYPTENAGERVLILDDLRKKIPPET